MSKAPCDACGQPFFGRSAFGYPAVLTTDGRRSRRVRFCGPCMSAYLQVLSGKLTQVRNGEYSLALGQDSCCVCGKSTDGEETAAVFITVYPKRDQRADFASLIHAACARQAEAEVLARGP